MSAAFALVRYTWRIAQKPFTKLDQYFSTASPNADTAARYANFYAHMLQIVYEYYEEKGAYASEKNVNRWKEEIGYVDDDGQYIKCRYEMISSMKFSDPDVKELLESPRRQVVVLRSIRSQTSSDPDDIVVLLRGTCVSLTDILDDFRIAGEVLHKSKRFKSTEKLVKELVNQQIVMGDRVYA